MNNKRINQFRRGLASCAVMGMIMFGGISTATATTVNFSVVADDYASLAIGGSPVCTSDTGGVGTCSGSSSMAPGVWYDITLDYKNRWGTNGILFTWDQPGDPVGWFPAEADVIPKLNLRTSDGAGGYVSGLNAKYYDLSGNHLFDVNGEGPIAAAGGDYYQNQLGLWAGTLTHSSQFEEVLTGQIQINAATTSTVPVPAAVWLFGSGLLGLIGMARRKK